MTAAPAMNQRLKYRLKIISGPHQNEIHTLDKDLIKVGRGDDNTIQLPRDGRISRNHMEIIWNGTEFRIKNLSQKNFVMLNERVIQEEALKPGGKIQIGETVFEVFEDGPILVSNENESKTVAVSTKPSSIAAVPAPAKIVPKANQTPVSPRAAVPSASAYGAPAVKTGSGGAPPSFGVPGAAANPGQRPPYGPTKKNNSRARFYIIIGLIFGLFAWLMSQESKPKEKLTFRTSQQVEYDRLQVEAEKAKLEEKIASQNNPLARQAQESMVKGFRDFQQGNYLRAREHFQSVLAKEPENQLATRYYYLSGTKHDELLQFHILQGLRYREKKNYRLCRSSFQSALIMIQNNSRHQRYREIKDFFDECNLALEGRF